MILRRAFGRPVAHRIADRLESGGVRGDVVRVRQAVAHDDVQHRQEQREVGAGADRQDRGRRCA